MGKVIGRSIVFLLILLNGVSSGIAQDVPPSVADILSADSQFSSFAALLRSAGLLESLAGEARYTVFAPDNAAFEQLSALVLSYLEQRPDTLRRVLNYHITPGLLSRQELFSQDSLPTLSDDVLQISPELGRVNGADLSPEEFGARNGYVHPVDAVLIPIFNLPPVDTMVSVDPILTAGSSTVGPLTDRMRTLFEDAGYAGTITVEETGTNVGIERFCVNAESDVANASRPILPGEIDACRANGREPIAFFVAIDAVSVVVNPENAFVESLTLEQLAAIFSGEAEQWSDVDPNFPDRSIQVYSPGANSGTLVYFAEAIFERDVDRILNAPNVRVSEDDTVLVSGVAANPDAIGYFGFSYYLVNQDRVRVVSIGGVEPTEATAESGLYELSRPLFIYTSPAIMQEKPQVAEFVKFYILNAETQLGTQPGQIGYFPVNRNIAHLDRLEWLAAMSAGR